MKKVIALDYSNIPTRPPVTGIVVWYLLLAHFNAPEYAYWVLGVFAVANLLSWGITYNNTLRIDLFESASKELEK